MSVAEAELLLAGKMLTRKRTAVPILNPFLFACEQGRVGTYFDKRFDSFVRMLSLTDEERVLAKRFQQMPYLSMRDVVRGMQEEHVAGTFLNLHMKLQDVGFDVPPRRAGLQKRAKTMVQVVGLAAARRSIEEIAEAVGVSEDTLREQVRPLLRRVLVEEGDVLQPTSKRLYVLGKTEQEADTYKRIRRTVLTRAVYQHSGFMQ